MKIYITGSTSLIATNIAKNLISKGHDVTLIGRKKPKEFKKFKFLVIDWQNIENIFSNNIKIDLLIHCAGLNAKSCILDPKEAMRFNSQITGKLSSLCALFGVKSFIYLSSVHVYGSEIEGIITENNKLCSTHPYAASKIEAEKLIESNLNETNTNYLVLRLSNIVSTPILMETKCCHLLPISLCLSIKKNNSLIINSNPNIKRDFVSMSELNKFIEFYILNIFNIKSGIFNFSSENVISIYDLALRIKEINHTIYGESSDIVFKKSNSKFIIKKFKYANRKLTSLGYKIKKDIDKELTRLLRQTKKNNFSCN